MRLFKNIYMVFIMLTTIFQRRNEVAADEFSGDSMKKFWKIYVCDENSACVVRNGMLTITADVEDTEDIHIKNASRILKKPLKRDWLIDTQLLLSSSGNRDTWYTGLTVYKNDNNWISWGILGNQRVMACGRIADEPIEFDIKSDMKYDFFRIRKRSNDSANTRYYFYYSEDKILWHCAGFFEDINNNLRDASYGFFAKSLGEKFYASYDYFNEYIPGNEVNKFNAHTLDMIWDWLPSNSTYMLNSDGIEFSISEGDRNPKIKMDASMLLRNPLDKNWIIDTVVTMHSEGGNNSYGLIVYKDRKNWLQWGPTGYGRMEACLMDGEKNQISVIGTAGELHDRIRIKKDDRTYYCQYSDDGLTWETCSEYIDGSWLWPNLKNARYGIVARDLGTGGFTVGFGFFKEKHKPSGVIKDIIELTEIAQLTGQDSINKTDEKYNVYGTDLGSMVEMNNKIFMMYGDTFGNYKSFWRSNVMAITTNMDPSEGILFDRMITNGQGDAKELITSKHIDYDDMTSIPTGGTSYNNVLYYHYMSVYHWGAGAHWDPNYSGWAYSEDEGQTWVKSESPKWSGNSNFILVACVKDKGIVYIFGTPGGRFGGVQLMKVPEDKILDQNAYEYYVGNFFGIPIWSKNEDKAAIIIEGPVGEISVIYNEYLGKWIITYLTEHTFDIELREADKPWGKWSNPVILVDHTVPIHNTWNYGAYMTPRFVKNNGEYIYFQMSKWVPYNVYLIKAKFIK